jgi:membrane protein implicated in regulation of membrane protease activity
MPQNQFKSDEPSLAPSSLFGSALLGINAVAWLVWYFFPWSLLFWRATVALVGFSALSAVILWLMREPETPKVKTPPTAG